MSLDAATVAKFTPIIDSILAASDINTISEKWVRKGLQTTVDYDITPLKDGIKELIMSRFDKFMANQTSNSDGDNPSPPSTKVKCRPSSPTSSIEDNHAVHKAPSQVSAPLKPKKRKVKEEESDAVLAARLQAMEDSRSRATRGGGAKPSKKIKASSKQKTPARVRAEDDSGIDMSDTEVKKRKINRNTGFHKELMLSAPLSALLDNQTKLSRPLIVKQIWAYVRTHDLQDKDDKRWILCDDPLKAVFKQEKVHMFTMNKILSQNLYPTDE